MIGVVRMSVDVIFTLLIDHNTVVVSKFELRLRLPKEIINSCFKVGYGSIKMDVGGSVRMKEKSRNRFGK